MTPKISVVMPVYRPRELQLETSIESILNQAFTDFEFIIICDKPRKEDIAVIKKYELEDQRVMCWYHSQRAGLVNSLNEGFTLAQGKYIARMDSDDFSRPERLQKQYDFMEAHPEIGISGSYHSLKREGTDSVCEYPLDDDRIRCALMFDTAFAHPTVIIRNDFIRTLPGPYDINFIHAEDYELWVRCAGKTKFANIPEVLVDIVNDGENASDANKKILLEQTVRIRGIAAAKFGFPQQDKLSKEQWLEQVYATNEILQVFPRDYLNERMGKDWYNYCLTLARNGMVAWQIFHASPLHDCINLSVKRKIKFLGACLLRWEAK